MSCYLKNIPADLKIGSGNRGISFPYNICQLPPEEVCYLAEKDDGDKLVLEQENGEPILLRCIE